MRMTKVPREGEDEEEVYPELVDVVELPLSADRPTHKERDMSAKPGYRTTEFISFAVIQLLLWLNAWMPEGVPHVDITPDLTATLSAGILAIYTLVRGWVKRNPTGDVTLVAGATDALTTGGRND